MTVANTNWSTQLTGGGEEIQRNLHHLNLVHLEKIAPPYNTLSANYWLCPSGRFPISMITCPVWFIAWLLKRNNVTICYRL